MRILVLDDNPSLARLIADSFQSHNVSVLHFNTPEEALENLQDRDTLVIDYDLRAMNGLEVARRAYAQGWRGPFLLMSGRSRSEDEQNLPSILNSMVTISLKPDFFVENPKPRDR